MGSRFECLLLVDFLEECLALDELVVALYLAVCREAWLFVAEWLVVTVVCLAAVLW